MKQAAILVGIVLGVTAIAWLALDTMGGKSTGDFKEGTGKVAKKGDKVSVFYTGKLANGKQFDSNVGREPFTFTLGKGEVIKGWDEGVVGMREGGKRKLVIPPEKGYGPKGMPPDIPPNAELHFDVELISVH